MSENFIVKKHSNKKNVALVTVCLFYPLLALIMDKLFDSFDNKRYKVQYFIFITNNILNYVINNTFN